MAVFFCRKASNFLFTFFGFGLTSSSSPSRTVSRGVALDTARERLLSAAPKKLPRKLEVCSSSFLAGSPAANPTRFAFPSSSDSPSPPVSVTCVAPKSASDNSPPDGLGGG
eukprot:CAMPEP_0205940634 /NCGR_PEP_ID=MMETSP1325-20131115/52809_1 /ASSEMBLY_ACC=CAM_ASM_000708 /TAXON_ID=236786 /ORGANISM="Florenciella sp., Strain RCC1007" /LENGTH=110 /DNA_ID=CAMNT_0053311197 /DNA_START=33 /DNA_END=362 /DNA_ORIENTATION=-